MTRQAHPFVRAFEDARAAWPGVRLDLDEFARHVTNLAGDSASLSVLERLHLTDLYLAAACVRGDRRALAWFEETFVSQVELFIRKVDPSPALAREVQQLIRVKLLVGAAERPAGLAQYGGRGPLGAWVRVAAIRLVHDVQRSERGHVPIEDDASVLAADHDPELSALRRRYTSDFNRAISSSLEELQPEERNMLRWHYLDGLSTDEIGAFARVNGSTVRRRLIALRRQLLERVRARLVAQLGVNNTELDSLLALVGSRLEITLSSQLRRSS